MAIMDSTTTTARGTITGSWRPRIAIFILLGKDGRGRLYVGAQYDGGAITDSTENTAGVICFFNNSAVADFKVVVVFGTTAFRNSNAIPDFYGFHSAD